MKHKVSLILILVLASCTISVSIFQTQDVNASTGNLEIGTTTYVIGQPLVVYVSDLTATSPLGITFTGGCNDNFNFTLGTTQTKISFTLKLSAPTSGDTCTITLLFYSDYWAGGGVYNTSATVDSVVLSATDYTDIIPEELIIGLAITILVISILVGIAITMRVRKGK